MENNCHDKILICQYKYFRDLLQKLAQAGKGAAEKQKPLSRRKDPEDGGRGSN
jgi:hypothetical protein